MMDRNPAPLPPARRTVGPGVLVAALAAIVAGLVLPLILGTFSQRQKLLLAALEAICLVVIAIGVIVLARRLR